MSKLMLSRRLPLNSIVSPLMSFVAKFKAWLDSRRIKRLDEWFFVTFDHEHVYIKATPPGKETWKDSFPWSSIVRVCFKDEGLYASDGLYIFTSHRLESFAIPTEGNGGGALFSALHDRGYFPDEIFTRAIRSTDGGLYCWPAVEEDGAVG